MPEAFRLCNIFEDNYRPDQNNDIDKKESDQGVELVLGLELFVAADKRCH